ncbi:MAG TPA: transcriptional regulator [Methanothrix soehngenii]|jgi:Mn-dependent DtxR family transcriptional regulator|uniref:transcriptional regulator n=1 Tax=Methanothrix soehngenii TaxID=2223 RepID=UPI002BDBE72D|nr:transcriptional regulator [Methanothrix soehngenii]
MADDMDAIMGFIMGNKQRERVVQILGSKGKMESDKVAKVTHIPAPSVKKILAEMAERDLVREENGIWGLTGAGEEIEKELKKRG